MNAIDYGEHRVEDINPPGIHETNTRHTHQMWVVGQSIHRYSLLGTDTTGVNVFPKSFQVDNIAATEVVLYHVRKFQNLRSVTPGEIFFGSPPFMDSTTFF